MKIGFIGLGIMGEAMCGRIVAGHDDTVYCYDVDPARTALLAEKGAVPCENGVELAEKSDVIITMVPKSEHVKAVYTSLLPVLGRGKICIDMSTIDPDVSLEVAAMVKKTGADFADAPVVKSRPAAEKGELGILVGCDDALFPAIRPVLAYMGRNIIRMGENGMGIVMKICHNSLVGQIQNGVNETMCLARRYGISPEDFHTAVAYGGAQNFYLDGQWEKLRDEDWTTAFSIDNMRKDAHIAMRMAAEQGFAMPGAANVMRVYDEAAEKGLGREDFRATYKIVKEGKA